MEKIWHKTAKGDYPKVFAPYSQESYPQIPCLVFMEKPRGYGVRFWNVTEECWDDEECDDYYCDKDNVSEWAYLDELAKL